MLQLSPRIQFAVSVEGATHGRAVAATLSAFKAGTADPLATTTFDNTDFSESDTATATFEKGDNTFLNAKIEAPKGDGQ